MAVTDADVHLNAKGMVCPMTVIKTKKALDAMKVGQVLEVVTTDRESDEELSAYAHRAGHEVLERHDDKGSFHIYIRRA